MTGVGRASAVQKHPQSAAARGSSFPVINCLKTAVHHILINYTLSLVLRRKKKKTWWSSGGLSKPNNVICFRFPVQSTLPLRGGGITPESASGSPFIFTASAHIHSANSSLFSHTHNYGVNRKEIRPQGLLQPLKAVGVTEATHA